MIFPAPFDSGEGEVLAEWIDANDHMNLAYYIVLFDRATDAIYEAFQIGPDYKERTGCGTFAVASHNLYEQELLLGERVRIDTYVLGVDSKRLHLAHEMYRLADGARAATQELLYLHIDLAARRVSPWPDEIRARLDAARAAHAALPRPSWVGQRVAMPGG